MPSDRKRLLVVCPYPENVAPAQRLKYEQYFNYFRANGYDITLSPFMSRPFWNIVYQRRHYLAKLLWTTYGYLRRVIDLFRLPFYDAVYVCLWVVPFGPPVLEWLFCLLNRNIVYDIDDLIFLKPKSEANSFVSYFKARSRVTFLLKKAKHVITCTPYLDGFARRYNPNTTDISSTINTEQYLPVNSYSNAGPVTLGWTGSHSTVKYLHLLKEVLLDLSHELPIRLLVVGDTRFKLEGLEVTAIPWVEETEVADLQKIDIGLYPLPDEHWVLGKSGLKALQYMALGIPTVATAVGANFRVVEDGVSGFLVRGPEEWKARITQLVGDPQLRREMGTQARQRVEALYSVRANRDTYLGILDAVVGQKANVSPADRKALASGSAGLRRS